jgi:hypothetical protein
MIEIETEPLLVEPSAHTYSSHVPVCQVLAGTFRTWRDTRLTSAKGSILLQKSKVASVRIFGEILKHEAIDDSDDLSRATEVAYEFSVRG